MINVDQPGGQITTINVNENVVNENNVNDNNVNVNRERKVNFEHV